MQEISMQQTERIGGGSIVQYLGTSLFISRLIMSGQVDYAGMAEQQGSYYNMMGA